MKIYPLIISLHRLKISFNFRSNSSYPQVFILLLSSQLSQLKKNGVMRWKHLLNSKKVCLPFDLILSVDAVQLFTHIISPDLRQEGCPLVDTDCHIHKDQKWEYQQQVRGSAAAFHKSSLYTGKYSHLLSQCWEQLLRQAARISTVWVETLCIYQISWDKLLKYL